MIIGHLFHKVLWLQVSYFCALEEDLLFIGVKCKRRLSTVFLTPFATSNMQSLCISFRKYYVREGRKIVTSQKTSSLAMRRTLPNIGGKLYL